jgi:hypothetical protein
MGERLAELNSRPEQLYPNTDEGRADLLESLNAGIAAMRSRLPRAFNDVPNDPLEIRRVPPAIQDGAPNGYYYRAALDGSRPAIYWINLRDTADWPKYGLPDLTYHEGVPGHHLQLSYVKQAGQLPLLVRTQGNSAYTEGCSMPRNWPATSMPFRGWSARAICNPAVPRQGWWWTPASTPNAGAARRPPTIWWPTPASPAAAAKARWNAIAR